MILKIKRKARGGFSLLEMTVVLIIITIIASAVIPQLINGYLVKAANKTALDMSAIEEASRAYYVANNNWPSNIAVLQAGNYLPVSWNAINPFGSSSSNPLNYSYNISSNISLLTVNTTVPIAAQPIIQNLLPVTSVSGNTIFSSVPVPGASNIIPTGTILVWPGTVAPPGFLLCDGSIYDYSSYPNLAPVLGSTFGGNGASTFAVPDLRGRTIVGLNTLSPSDGTDRIWFTDTYSNNQGQVASYNVNQIGGIFGEEKHRQTLTEMAPHSHGSMLLQSPGDNSHGLPGGSGTGYGNSGIAGGNGDGMGLGFAANVVQPSITMWYIIKY